MSSSWDIAIVGAGPAGAASAIIAARMGLKVVVVDVAEFPRQKVCGEYLTPAAWRLLAELGIADIRERAVPLPTMQLTAGETYRVTMGFGDEQHAPRSLSRYALDVRLVEEARRAGATILTGRRVRHVIVEDDRAAGIECAGDADHEPGERLRARLIVAADGRRSVVVRDTGNLNRRDLGLFGFKRHVRLADDVTRSAITLHALPGGYVGTSPTEDGSLNMCGVMPRCLVKAARGDVASALNDWLADRPTLRSYVAATGDGPWQTMPDVSLQAARPNVAGVLYVGDAQGTIEPLTGQGITMALASARLASELFRRYGVDGIDEAAQQSYASEWRANFARPIRAATWCGRLLRRPTLLKSILLAGFPLPGLSRRFLGVAHNRTLSVSDSFIKN